jgi:hypothetical protein
MNSVVIKAVDSGVGEIAKRRDIADYFLEWVDM